MTDLLLHQPPPIRLSLRERLRIVLARRPRLVAGIPLVLTVFWWILAIWFAVGTVVLTIRNVTGTTVDWSANAVVFVATFATGSLFLIALRRSTRALLAWLSTAPRMRWDCPNCGHQYLWDWSNSPDPRLGERVLLLCAECWLYFGAIWTGRVFAATDLVTADPTPEQRRAVGDANGLVRRPG
jgi:hypothetical protein